LTEQREEIEDEACSGVICEGHEDVDAFTGVWIQPKNEILAS
jgi:hypothetical protein